MGLSFLGARERQTGEARANPEMVQEGKAGAVGERVSFACYGGMELIGN